MNWTLALPEIVLACLGMAILIFGVLRKQEATTLATMFTIGAFLITGFLVGTTHVGILLVAHLVSRRAAAGLQP